MKKITSSLLLFSLLIPQIVFAQSPSNEMIVVNKSVNKLVFYEDGKFVSIYDVATGRDSSFTPEGSFQIVNKIVNPPYYKTHIPGGDPSNPLGNRWMGLNVPGTVGTMYGIHGNNDESSIGHYASAGCVRMHNSQVQVLFNEVELNTPVIITTSPSSFDKIAKENGYALAFGYDDYINKEKKMKLKKEMNFIIKSLTLIQIVSFRKNLLLLKIKKHFI